MPIKKLCYKAREEWQKCAIFIVALLLTDNLVAQQLAETVKARDASGAKRPQPITLRTVYEAKDRLNQAGGGADLITYDITFEFTNALPMPVRVAFPPIGVFTGQQIPFAKADDTDIPKFAQVDKILELGPNQSRSFTSSGHAIIGKPGPYEWVFGKPAKGPLPQNLFVGSIFSVAEPNNDSDAD